MGIFFRKSKIQMLLLAISIAVTNTSIAQSILISTGGTANVNGGEVFYDAGGAAGNDGNTNQTITLCPSVAGKSVYLDFTMFNTYFNSSSLTWKYGDSVCIFNGSSTAAPKIATLLGNYGSPYNSGSNPTPVGLGAGTGLGAVTSPGVFSSTASNGCLTISFYNADATQSPGWAANVGLYTPLGVPGCTINLTASNNTICAGSTITLTALGNIVSAAINNNFNTSSVGSGWLSTSAATFPNNACSKPSLDASTYLWMANASCPRTLTSNGMDVSNGGNVSFEYRQADDNGSASPCESPDIGSGSTPESVFLQYSINGGTAWTTMKVMYPHNIQSSFGSDNYNGIGYEVKTWNRNVIPIPAAAKTTNTQFRWIMPICTNSSTDNWGLDNVIISSLKTSTITIKNLTTNVVLGTSTISPFVITDTPTSTTVYEASITDGVTTCTSTQTVTVNSGVAPVTSFTYASPQCVNSLNQSPTLALGFTTGGAYTSTPSGLSLNGSSGLVNMSSSASGTYVVTYSIAAGSCGSGSSNTSTLIINQTPTVSVANATICSGTSTTLTASGATSYTWSNSATLSSANGNTVVATPLSNTIYTVTGSISNCTHSVVANVTVNNCVVNACGSCASPTCPIAGPYLNYAAANTSTNQCSQMSTLSPYLLGATTYTSYHTVTTSTSSGTLGAIASVGASTGGGGGCSVTRVAKLYPVGSGCSGAILPSSTTANGSTFYNPEWYGLALNTSYVLEIVYTIPAGCTMQDYCASYYAPTIPVTPSCGSCTTPTCPIGSVATYTNRTYVVCQNGISLTNTTYTEYHTVTADAFGNVGIAQQFQLASGVNSGVTRSAYLLPLGNCGASQILPSITNANGVASSFNPEWYGLTPGTQYIVVITITVASGTTIDQLCTDYYGIPRVCSTVGFGWNLSAPTAAQLSCSNNTNYGLQANNTYNEGVNYSIEPGFIIESNVYGDNINDVSSNITLTSLQIEEGAGTGFVTIPTTNIEITNCNTSLQYSLKLFGNVSVVGSLVKIIDRATGVVLYNGVFTNGMTIVLPPNTIKGTATFSGPGVSNYQLNYPTVGNTTFTGAGYGVFNPSLAGAGTHTITYSWNNGMGCSGTSTLAVTVTGLTVTTTSATVCAGATGTLTASGATNYSWTSGLSAPTGSLVTGNPTSITVYTVTGTVGSCSSTATSTITVNANPTVTTTSATVCEGATGTLTASGATNYSWTSGLSALTGSLVTGNPTSTTVYTVTGTVGSCSSTATSTITVNANPTVSIFSPSLSICFGGSVTLTANGATNYTWSPLGTLSNINSNTAIASPVNSTTYTVIGANSNNCVGTNSFVVSILPLITPTICQSQTICKGQTASLYVLGGNTFHWQPSQNVVNANSSSTTSQPNATTIYTVTVSNNNLCPVTSTVQINVNPLPIVYAGRDTIINIDEEVVLKGTGNVIVGFLSPDGMPLNCNYCPIVTVHPLTTTCYVLQGEDPSTLCRNWDTVCVNITKDWEVFVPNAFTPNDDLDNEYFLPKGYGIAQINLTIFDRWGTQIFKEKGTTLGWDGKYKGQQCKQDVYVYQIEVISMGGVSFNKTGHVTLIGKNK